MRRIIPYFVQWSEDQEMLRSRAHNLSFERAGDGSSGGGLDRLDEGVWVMVLSWIMKDVSWAAKSIARSGENRTRAHLVITGVV